MNIISVKDYKEMSQTAAGIIINKVKSDPSITLGLATGGTPKGLYEALIQDHQTNGTSYEQVHTFNLDEYVGLSADNPNSYRYYMVDTLLGHLDVALNQTFIPNGTAEDAEAECERYEALIEQLGGIDLQILGIGHNGHIGFNEPGTPFSSKTHVVTLASSTRQANARYFSSIDEVPTHAITMGISSIMNSTEILLLASGEDKADAIYHLLEGTVTEEFPASILKNHQAVTIIADEKALSRTNL
ncbi:glucosamine-6-phosphate deaminase [Bacillus sp. VT 712]|jgi:glucosamine-6-phosphate deaminase|uniref:glucosamine-6-phosphate deaminase n=1 Tax=Bacillaceae TaxID=186817 RepID=UPI0007A45C95|nr:MULTISPECIES: glucosamine-6-phosphate deaminase [Bacillaceae]AQX55501.1 glucosamine-6-phosphate deaminase [Priestia flexa]KZB90742.1 glucosamine-6-phosphate deaminase [Bacillus sp. VT 712]MBY6086166.1 glucosamine-6-phosphate deaminase [Priestia flexa]MCG7313093.1 glucosamine-6-phosphate deaminase [Priestia flexa]MEC0667467.1 glucosamine-6-phosphate deaminase [Priestia flexa]